MKYEMDITGMHCQGCATLIKLQLEDSGFSDVSIDVSNNKGSFSGSEAEEATREKLVQAFADLPGYGYTNLRSVS